MSLKRDFINNVKEIVCMIQIFKSLFTRCLIRIQLMVWCYFVIKKLLFKVADKSKVYKSQLRVKQPVLTETRRRRC